MSELIVPAESHIGDGAGQNGKTSLLVGITGRFGVGKNTVADILARLLHAQVVAFADQLKEDVTAACIDAVPDIVDYPTMRAWLDERKGTVFGPLLQGYGEFWRQWMGQDYWIKSLEDSLPDRAIVADVRYVNEAEWIKARGGTLLWIAGANWRMDEEDRDPNHPSEAGVEACARLADFVIRNTRTLEHLERDVMLAAKEIAAKHAGVQG